MVDLFNGEKGALFSDCRKYRYRLWRIWDKSKPVVMCIGLNPSTANHAHSDPTITNLSTALNVLGYGGFYMMNLFAFISSKPDVLLTVSDAVGANDEHLTQVRDLCQDVIFCWGTFKQAKERIAIVAPMYPGAKCFGHNYDGTPRHPLSLMYEGDVRTPVLTNYKLQPSK